METNSHCAIDSLNDLQIEANEPYEIQRARAWEHKQQLDRLPTFSLKLEYWLKNIGPSPDSTVHHKGKKALFTLELKPETDDDLRKLHRFWMDYYRKQYAQAKREVNKFGWRFSEADKEKAAYHVQPLEALKSDLESRLSTATRKQDLLQAELTKITASIDAVDKTVNGIPLTLAREIKELRLSLETNRLYDFAFVNENLPVEKAIHLAEVWDIVHYEKYLKDKLAELQMVPADLILPADDNSKKNRLIHSLGFDMYIEESHRERLMPCLVDRYSNAQPKQYGYMLYALVKMGYMPQTALNSNKTALHKALTKTFGEFGTRQALNTAIQRLDSSEITPEDRQNVAEYTRQIQTFLRSETTC